jgi:hypothetical protein
MQVATHRSGPLAHGGDVLAQLSIRAAERRQDAEPAGVRHRRDEIDAAATLHGALQDRDTESEEIANRSVEHGAPQTFVPTMRLSDPGMNSSTVTSRKPAAAK